VCLCVRFVCVCVYALLCACQQPAAALCTFACVCIHLCVCVYVCVFCVRLSVYSCFVFVQVTRRLPAVSDPVLLLHNFGVCVAQYLCVCVCVSVCVRVRVCVLLCLHIYLQAMCVRKIVCM
jgi:hypothetical protein